VAEAQLDVGSPAACAYLHLGAPMSPPPQERGPQASAVDLWNPCPLTYEKGNYVLYEHYHY
ncbi:uncharacterized protein METZ01_LOCUS270680, partial [marine metagenome]